MTSALAVVDLGLQATAAYGRPDLGQRLTSRRERLADPTVRVLVVGEFKQGKSELINAIVGARVCPTDDDVATAVPTVVGHAEAPTATLVDESGTHRADVALERLAGHVSEAGNPGNREGVAHVEVGLPRQLLTDGLVLVDTPGVGGLGARHATSTMAALAEADAVLLVSDAAQEYTRPELDFLDAATRLCPTVACVLTKTDLYRQWRRIADLDRGHLTEVGVEAELFAVSSTVRQHALRTGDRELAAESGFDQLIEFLRDRVVGQAELLARRSARHDVLAVAEQLATGMRAELDAQRNPERAETLVAELESARQRAAELKERSARWQTTLNDGVADVTADVDHDLRDRLRAVTREAEDALDAADPATIWDQFGAWVGQQVSTAAADNFVLLAERARQLADRVAEHFAEGGQAVLPELRLESTEAAHQRAAGLTQPEVEGFGLGQQALTGMRGGYIGGLMFGVLAGMTGLAVLVPPVSIGAGVLLGAKSIREERKRRLTQRRTDAKAAVRKHIDDVTFQAGKDCRDMLRELQRTLRDHFTEQAETLQNSITESVNAAQQAVKTDESQRAARIRDLEAELERVGLLAARARALTEDAA